MSNLKTRLRRIEVNTFGTPTKPKWAPGEAARSFMERLEALIEAGFQEAVEEFFRSCSTEQLDALIIAGEADENDEGQTTDAA